MRIGAVGSHLNQLAILGDCRRIVALLNESHAEIMARHQIVGIDFERLIETHYYAAIITDQSDFEVEPALHGLLTSYYVQAETFSVSQAPATTVGVVVRPQLLYTPRAP